VVEWVIGLLISEPSSDEIRNIRVRYSTILNYLSILYGALMGLIFTTIVLRRISVDEYGLFNVLIAYIYLLQPVSTIWFFWMYRFYTRKRMDLYSAGGGINFFYTTLSFIIMYVITYLYTENHVLALIVGLTTAIQVFLPYYFQAVSATRPYMIGYIQIASDSVRTVFLYITVGVLRYGLYGVLSTVLIEFLMKIVLGYFVAVRYRIEIPRLSFDLHKISIYVKNSYIALLNIFSSQLMTSGERLLTSFIGNTLELPAYLGVSYLSRTLIAGGASAFGQGISSRLLRAPSRIDVEDTLRISILIVIFVSGSIAIFSTPILSFLNPAYLNIRFLFILYSASFAILAIEQLLLTISNSLEDMDIYSVGADLRKSFLFKNSMLQLLASIIHVFGGTLCFYILTRYSSNPNILLLPYPLIATASYLAASIILVNRIRAKLLFNIPWREVAAGFIGLITLYAISIATGWINTEFTNIYKGLTLATLIAVASLTIYVATLYIVSPWFRKFLSTGFRSVFRRN